MNNYLSKINKIKGHKSKSKRLGRGISSGRGGHQSSKGNKGHKARSGGGSKLWFEGGQTPLVKRLPYTKGFNRYSRKNSIEFNLTEISNILGEDDNISPEIINEKGYIKNFSKVERIKILGNGNIQKAVSFTGFDYTKNASDKILKAGGKVE